MSRSITNIDNSYKNAIQPDSIILNMKDHQLKMLNRCLELEGGDLRYENSCFMIETNFGVIGNPVGSGKSLIVLAIMSSFITDRKVYHEQTENFKVYYTNEVYTTKNINILVVPHTIFGQWKEYITKQTTLQFEYIRTKKDLQDIKYDKSNIIVSSSVYNEFAEKANEKMYTFSRVIYDEADSINLPNCKKLFYRFCWFVTSSVNNLLYPGGYKFRWNPQTKRYENIIVGIKKNGFIKKTFKDFDYNAFSKHIFLRNDENLIKQSFSLPDIINLTYICKNLNILSVLNNLVPLNIQQMICAGDLEGAINAINIEKTDENNLIKIVCNNIYNDIDNKLIDLDSTKKKNYKNKTKQIEDIAKLENDIAKLEGKIESIKNKIKECDMDPITFCEIEIPTLVKCCNQLFDFESITIYLTSTNQPLCPMCRSPITKDSLIIVKEKEEEQEETKEEDVEEFEGQEHDKIENLNYILQNKVKSNAKILIFSEHDGSFVHISKVLGDLNINYKMLKGSGYSIVNTINWFKENDNTKKVLFLNAKFLGSGLELQMSDDIIIYHKMDKELETQVVGRAQRIGRTNSLNVHHLLYESE